PMTPMTPDSSTSTWTPTSRRASGRRWTDRPARAWLTVYPPIAEAKEVCPVLAIPLLAAPPHASAFWAASDSPFQRSLRDPGPAMHALADHLHAWAVHTGPVLGPALAAAIGAAVAARRAWARRCHSKLEAGARVVAILPPPEVEPAGAAALWSNL